MIKLIKKKEEPEENKDENKKKELVDLDGPSPARYNYLKPFGFDAPKVSMKGRHNTPIKKKGEKEGHKFDLIDIIQGEGDLYNNNISYENKILKKIGKKDEEEEEEELDDILNHLEQLENIFGTKKTLEQCIKR